MTTKLTLFMTSAASTALENYIGGRGQPLRTRLNSPRLDIIHHCNKPVANHFSQTNHYLDNFKAAVLAKI